MIVDDNSKNVAKKRMTLLNKDFKYIGVNSKLIGKISLPILLFQDNN